MSDTVVAALIAAAALIVTTVIQVSIKRDTKAAKAGAEKAVEQTKNVSNGFAQDMRDTVADIVTRLDNQDRARYRRDAQVNMLVAKLDDRLVRIEEKL